MNFNIFIRAMFWGFINPQNLILFYYAYLQIVFDKLNPLEFDFSLFVSICFTTFIFMIPYLWLFYKTNNKANFFTLVLLYMFLVILYLIGVPLYLDYKIT